MTKISLKAARINTGLTQAQAAEKLGFKRSSIIAYEQGKRVPKLDIAYKFSELYNVDIADIDFFRHEQ